MKVVRPTIAFEVVWFDNDMLELSLNASNAKFAGQTTFYVNLETPTAFAAHIEGFPRNSEDVREYEFGGTNLPGYGGARIRISCKDRSGHLLVHASIYSVPLSKTEVVQSATVQIEATPADVDAFVQQLKHLQARVGDMAVLPAAT